MESIRDVLSRITIPKSTAGAPTATSSSSRCPTCGGAGWLRLEVDLDDPRFGQTVPCACKAREIEEKKMRVLLERSNLLALQDKTFAAFRPQEHQKHAYDRAREFAERPEGWFVLLGSFGTGKTHLAAAIGNRRLELGQAAIFVVVPDLLDHLRATFSPSSETRFDEFFESVRRAPLLILDDLGTQTTTPWATEKLFQILNDRYMTKLPTVITTNVPLDELGARLASRMSDPELSICVSLAGPDWRAARDSDAASRGTPPSGRSRSRQQNRTF
jgi:DNA replication protein DnaC